jgi:predicted lipoprotein with Yx(FWY)xxD motif
MHSRQANIVRTLVVLAVLGGGAVPAALAAAGSGPTLTTENAKPGKVIATTKGTAVYVFSKDSGSSSSCTGKCPAAWPPLQGTVKLASGSGLDPKKLGKISRGRGQSQVTYAGHPLYTLSGDKAHQTTGQGASQFGGHWYVVGPKGAAIKPKQKYCNPVCQGY